MATPILSDDATSVLRVLRERAMDGYSLRARTGLGIEKLATAVMELARRELVLVKGELTAERLGEAYLSVPPNALGYVDMLLTPHGFRRAL